jgi:hypothetical protein
LSRELDLPDTVRVWDSMFSDPHRFQLLPELCCAMLMRQRTRLLAGDFSHNLKLLQRYPPTDILTLLADARAIRAGQYARRTHTPNASAARADAAALRLAQAQAKLKETGTRASSAAAAASVRARMWSKQAEAGWSALMANTRTVASSVARTQINNSSPPPPPSDGNVKPSASGA